MFKIVIGEMLLKKMELYINKENVKVRDTFEKNGITHVFIEIISKRITFMTCHYSIFKYVNAIHKFFAIIVA